MEGNRPENFGGGSCKKDDGVDRWALISLGKGDGSSTKRGQVDLNGFKGPKKNGKFNGVVEQPAKRKERAKVLAC